MSNVLTFSAGDDAAAAELRRRAHTRPLPEAHDAFEAAFVAAFFSINRAGVLGDWNVVPDTTVYPWRAIAYLDILTVDPNGLEEKWRGTGFLVSPRTLLTAGHNVYFHDRGGWARSITVHPGRNAQGSPFGSVAATRFLTVNGWLDSKSRDHDYGAIVLDEDLGSSLGYFGILEPSDADLSTHGLALAGYPNTIGEQVAGEGRSQNDTTDLRIYYDVPTAIGQSGAPVWFRDDPRAIGVHAYDSGALNSGVRINADVYAQLLTWRQ